MSGEISVGPTANMRMACLEPQSLVENSSRIEAPRNVFASAAKRTWALGKECGL